MEENKITTFYPFKYTVVRNKFYFFPKVLASSTPPMTGGMGSEITLSAEQSIFDPPPEETGWDRVKSIWDTNKYEEFSPEFHIIKNNIFSGIFFGGCLGAFVHSRTFAEDYLRKNRERLYVNVTDAKRHYQDNFILTMMKGGVQWGWRLGLFCGIYSTISISIALYRNRISIWDHIIAGGFCGAVWKHRQGLRAVGVAGLLGSALGAVAGGLVVGIMWFSGMTLPELRYWHHCRWEDKIRNSTQRRNKALKDDGAKMLQAHDKLISSIQPEEQKS